MSRRFTGYFIAAALVSAAACVACSALVGPATRQPECPVLCGHYEGQAICCRYDQECSRTGWPDMPCRPSAGFLGASRDGGKQ